MNDFSHLILYGENQKRSLKMRTCPDILEKQVDQFGRPYEAIWFPPGQEEPAVEASPRTSSNPSNGATANIDTRLLADGPVYANAPPLVTEGRKVLE